MIQKTLNNKKAEIYICQYCGRESVKPLRTAACPVCQEKVRAYNRENKDSPRCFMGHCMRLPQYRKGLYFVVDDFCVDAEAMTGAHGQCSDFLEYNELENLNKPNPEIMQLAKQLIIASGLDLPDAALINDQIFISGFPGYWAKFKKGSNQFKYDIFYHCINADLCHKDLVAYWNPTSGWHNCHGIPFPTFFGGQIIGVLCPSCFEKKWRYRVELE